MKAKRLAYWGQTLGLLLLALMSFTACGADSVDKEAVLREMADERIDKFRRNSLRDCREEVLEVANQRADSLLLERARRMRLLANRPPKPQRPGAPPERDLSEELPLRPLFPYEVRFDTVLRQQLTLDSLLLDTLQYADTLECVDCFLWAEVELPPSSGIEPPNTDSLVGLLDIYRLLCGLQASCLEDATYGQLYRDQLLEAILQRPRALELCLQALVDPETHPTSYYLNPLTAPSEKSIDFDLLRQRIDQEIVEAELRQQLLAIIERIQAGY